MTSLLQYQYTCVCSSPNFNDPVYIERVVCSLKFNVLLQVEKRVVNKLAAAYEQGVITKKSQVNLAVDRERESGPSSVRLQIRNERSGDKKAGVITEQLSIAKHYSQNYCHILSCSPTPTPNTHMYTILCATHWCIYVYYIDHFICLCVWFVSFTELKYYYTLGKRLFSAVSLRTKNLYQQYLNIE